MTDILLVEDQENLAIILQYDLSQAGFSVHILDDGLVAKKHIETHAYQIYILDWMLPGISGLSLCEQIRTTYPQAHIVMLTAKGEEMDKIEAFKHGADDYITKPFSTREFIARLRAAQKKYLFNQQPTLVEQQTLAFHDITIFPEQRIVKIADHPIDLTLKEYELLVYFVKHAEKVVSREKLLESIWGYDYDGENRTIDVYVFKLRAKLEQCSHLKLKTVRGIGYMLSS